MVYSLVQTLGEFFKACSFKKQKHNALYELSFHFGKFVCGVFGDKVTKILRNCLFIFPFLLAHLALQTENIAQKITQAK